MTIIVLNFENMNTVPNATKKSHLILVKDPIGSSFFLMQMRKCKAIIKQWNNVSFYTIFRKAQPFYIRVEQIVAFGN